MQLSWSDLPYRYATKELMENHGPFSVNPHVETFLNQFSGLDQDHKACFLFPESFVSQFFVISEVCRRAEQFHPVQSLFPDEGKVHFLAVFDKERMDDVLLMYHLLYTNASQDVFGGYSLYDYSLPWYQTHLCENDTVLRSPWLPDRIAKYQGNLPYHFNPSKTVYVRRNIGHILENGYFSSELEFFWNDASSKDGIGPNGIGSGEGYGDREDLEMCECWIEKVDGKWRVAKEASIRSNAAYRRVLGDD